jgi:Domain of unknown function (DUF4440)
MDVHHSKPRRHALAAAMVLALGALHAAPAAAQGAAPAHVTRAVQAFTELENTLLRAIRERDGTRLGGLLGDDFEMIVAPSPASPVPREDWLASVRKPGAGAYAVEDMSVREMGSVAIASFVLRPAPARPGAVPVFMVDTWERADATHWQLTARHAAVVAGSRRSIPGDAKPTTVRKQI